MAVRQGAVQPRDLHEDTTGPDQERKGGGGGGDATNHSYMLIQLVSTTYQTIHNSPSVVDRSVCGNSVYKRGHITVTPNTAMMTQCAGFISSLYII